MCKDSLAGIQVTTHKNWTKKVFEVEKVAKLHQKKNIEVPQADNDLEEELNNLSELMELLTPEEQDILFALVYDNTPISEWEIFYEPFCLLLMSIVDQEDRASRLLNAEFARRYVFRFLMGISEIASTGYKSREGSKQGSDKLRNETQAEHSEVRKKAKKVWSNNPALSKRRVAQILRVKHGVDYAESTIRKMI